MVTRLPRTIGTAATSSGTSTPAPAWIANTHHGMVRLARSRFSSTATDLARLRAPMMLAGSARATDATPTSPISVPYSTAICPLRAPTVFIAPISRTCRASIAEIDVATRIALRTSAIALNASMRNSTAIICVWCGCRPGGGTRTSSTG